MLTNTKSPSLGRPPFQILFLTLNRHSTVIVVVCLLQLLLTGVAAPVPFQDTKAPSTPQSSKQYNLALEIKSPTEGVNFDQYLKDLHLAIKRNWIGRIPKQAAEGKKVFVIVTLIVSQDESVPTQFPKVIRSSGLKDFDEAAVAAVRAKAPSVQLPKDFHAPSIELRLVFLYDMPLEKPN